MPSSKRSKVHIKSSLLKKRRKKLLARQERLISLRATNLEAWVGGHPKFAFQMNIWVRDASDCAIRMRDAGIGDQGLLDEYIIEEIMEL